MPERPCLDETRCHACEVCVAVCPTACLEMDGRRPWMPRPGECVHCTLCVLVCPPQALRMEDEAA